METPNQFPEKNDSKPSKVLGCLGEITIIILGMAWAFAKEFWRILGNILMNR